MPFYGDLRKTYFKWFLFLSVLNSLHALAGESSNLVVHLRWAPVPGVKKYGIQISEDEKFRRILAEAESNQSEWIWKYPLEIVGSKRVFYRICSMDQEGFKGVYSQPEIILIPDHKPHRPAWYQVQTGALYHWRTFVQSDNPTRVKGNGLIPGVLDIQASFPQVFGTAGLGIEMFFVPEQGTSSQGDRLFLPLWRGTLTVYPLRWGYFRGIGLSTTLSQKIIYISDGKFEAAFRPLGGISTEFGSDPTNHRRWTWRVLPAFYGVGSTGLDVAASLSYWPAWGKNLSISFTADFRIFAIEHGSSLGTRIGYAF